MEAHVSDKGSVPGTASARIITKVVFTYRLEGDPKDTERSMVLENGSGGEVVDGIVWGEELMRKLAYMEGKDCIEPTKREGRGDWKVYSPEAGMQSEARDTKKLSTTRSLTDADVTAGETRTSAAADGDCIYIHTITCEWDRYCPPPVL